MCGVREESVKLESTSKTGPCLLFLWEEKHSFVAPLIDQPAGQVVIFFELPSRLFMYIYWTYVAT
jgi:hypothetical protein